MQRIQILVVVVAALLPVVPVAGRLGSLAGDVDGRPGPHASGPEAVHWEALVPAAAGQQDQDESQEQGPPTRPIGPEVAANDNGNDDRANDVAASESEGPMPIRDDLPMLMPSVVRNSQLAAMDTEDNDDDDDADADADSSDDPEDEPEMSPPAALLTVNFPHPPRHPHKRPRHHHHHHHHHYYYDHHRTAAPAPATSPPSPPQHTEGQRPGYRVRLHATGTDGGVQDLLRRIGTAIASLEPHGHVPTTAAAASAAPGPPRTDDRPSTPPPSPSATAKGADGGDGSSAAEFPRSSLSSSPTPPRPTAVVTGRPPRATIEF